MHAETHGYFSRTLDGPPAGQRYAFSLDGGRELPDPASRYQPEGVHAPSVVWDPSTFPWSDSEWRGVSRRELAIYELHVGTFTAEGTFDAIIPRLDALVELGITAVELMPVAQFPGRRNWGYDGTCWYAVQNSYGGPHGLQRLVNACHAAGLAIILDVVYNHLGPEGNYLEEFGPYFTERFHTPWGPALNFDDRGCDAVREFVLQNVRQWLRDFHIDGLRLDAVHSIFDAGPRHILAEIKRTADEVASHQRREVHIIAESNLNDARLLLPREHGGYGFDAQWNDDFHHCVHTLLTGERDGYYVDFSSPERQLEKVFNRAFAYDGNYSPFRDRRHGAPADDISRERFIVSIQTHDQVGNRARGERLSELVAPNQLRLGVALMLLSPFTPMFFMGEEYGEQRPFPFFCDFGDPALSQAVRRGRREEFADFAWSDDAPDPTDERTFQAARLTWNWPRGSWQAGLRRLYEDLLLARRTWPALQACGCCTAVLESGTNGAVLLRLERRVRNQPDDRIVAYFNLSHRETERSSCDDLGLLLRSEAPRYGGTLTANSSDAVLAPWECLAFGGLTEPMP